MAFSGIGNDKERIASSCLLFLPLTQKSEAWNEAGGWQFQGSRSNPPHRASSSRGTPCHGILGALKVYWMHLWKKNSSEVFKIHLGFVLNRKAPCLVQKVPEPETTVSRASVLGEVLLQGWPTFVLFAGLSLLLQIGGYLAWAPSLTC